MKLETRRKAERGVALTELAIILPLMLIMMLASVDVGRLIYRDQVLTDLTRGAGNLVSRGSTPAEAFAATFAADKNLDLQNKGGIIITRVRRRNTNNAQPWVYEQDRAGANTTYTSKIGAVNGPANIPNVTSLAPGVTIMGVEIVNDYTPLFPFAELGLNFYPDTLYAAAYF